MKKSICFVLVWIILVLTSCSSLDNQASLNGGYQNYKEIPGVTQKDINAIESLYNKKPHLIFGANISTEAFLRNDGEIGGFDVLFTERMSQLLGFDFEVYICGWDELIHKLESHEIDFAGDLTPSPERLKKYYMTDPIVQRTLKVFTDINNESLSSIAAKRPIRCAFLEDSTIFPLVSSTWNLPFEPVYINNSHEVPELFLNGKIDTYIDEGVAEAIYDEYDFLVSEDYYPLNYSPCSLTTANPDLAPIINIMQKYLDNGGYYELTEIYNQGEKDYLKHKLSLLLTEEENLYIRERISSQIDIPVACEIDNYPTGFYNTKEKAFQGIAIDVLSQVTDLTGLNFEVKNKPTEPWPVLLSGLENGEYALVSELLLSEQRKDRFIWPDVSYVDDTYALLSKADYPDVNINQVLFSKVGLLEDSAYAESFLEWFPDSVNTITYVSSDYAFTALEKGEIDLLMSTQHTLLNLTNYMEKPGFKANIIFKYSSSSYFGFNKNEEILCSIVNKALRYIDTEATSAHWQRKVFDYQSKFLKDTFPYLIGFALLLSTGLVLVFILFIKNRQISKNLELIVTQRTNELAFQTSTLTTMFEAIPDLVFCKDLNFCYTRCNKSFEDIFGQSEDQIIGKDDVNGLGISHEVAAGFRKIDEAVIKSGKSLTFEEYVPLLDGSSRIFETIKIPLFQDDKIIGIMGISRDINIRKVAEEQAQAASRAKSDFLSRMSHEIRTPLNAIIGMTGIAKNSDNLEKIRHCHERVDSASKHLLGIINDILDMSKIEADKFEIDCREFDLEKMLMSITDVTSFRSEEKMQNFIVNLDKDVPTSIIGDDLRLSQVITNLLTNAVKFTPENGTIILNINKIKEADDQITLKIQVEDNGIGISKSQQKKLFTSFEQADGGIARKFGGTGLGLAISKRIVELMGGEIWIESEPGIGSKFIFTVKVRRGGEKFHTKVSDKINKDNLRILVVDDLPETRDYFSNIMAAHDLACDVADEGATALDMIKKYGESAYNMFFIDWRMPGMNGIELAKKIKAISENTIIIMMISMSDWSNIEKEALEVGVKSFVSKPLFPSMLINTINEYLDPNSAKSTIRVKNSFAKKTLNLHSHTILIAEDVEVNRDIMSALLEDTGITIDFAENGQIAVSKFEENPDKYSLIFMDVHMPQMDGYEATRRIRNMKSDKSISIPIVAMTANVFREDVENCLAAGMNDHIGKPIEPKILFDKLDQYLPHKESSVIEVEHKYESNTVLSKQQIVTDPQFLPVIDIEGGLNRLMNNKKLYLKLLTDFKGREMVEELINNITDSDYSKAVQTSHALKGVSANLGLMELMHIASNIETQAKIKMDPSGLIMALNEALEAATHSIKTLLEGDDIK